MATRTRKTRKPAQGTVELPMLTRAARVSSVDMEARTVEVVWTTGARAPMYSYPIGRFDESLSLEKADVRTGRLESGRMNVLEQHGRGARFSERPLDGVIGVVPTGRLVPKREGVATLRFSKRERAEELFRDVADGIIQNVSVGYVVHRYEELTEPGAKVRHLLAVDWEPTEISLTDIPADAGVGTREASSGGDQTHTCEIVTRTRESMDPEEENENQGQGEQATGQGERAASPQPKPEAKPPAPAPRTPSEPDSAHLERARQEGAQAERVRGDSIRTAAKKAGLGGEFAESLVREGVSVELARERVIDELARASEADPQSSRSRVEVGAETKRAGMRAAIALSLLNRARPADYELTDQAREYRGLSLLDIGRELLEVKGEKTRGLGRLELAERAMQSTSDFPAIVADVANKSLRKSYEEAPKTWGAIVSETEARDFKNLNPTQLSAAPSLNEVNEHGEFTHGKMLDGKETYAVATYGRTTGLTRQAMVNDDLGAFTRIPRLFASAAARKQADVIWGLILANGAMADTFALFSAEHSNTGVQTLTDETDLQELVQKLRQQTGLQGELLNLAPSWLLVPTALELKARRLTADVSPRNQGDVNPWAGSIQPIVEPRLDVNPAYWYMAASPSMVDIIEVAYLDGARVPAIETRNGWEVDGVEIKCRYDFGAGVIDHRGIARSIGTT